MAHTFDDVDQLAITTLRTLAMDAVEAAQSGHPGTPMALAPVAWVLYSRILRHDPGEPDWPGRDRFILSCGHASMLLYGILHLSGYDLPLEELERFRQWESRTPGHPENWVTPGVETTTGPLGQGCGNSVGMAIAAEHLAARFNRGEHRVVDPTIYVLCSDGDLMEGVASEAASLAGHLGLGRLVWIWDDNRITIEGGTDLAFSEQVLTRFEGYGWHTSALDDANDLEGLCRVIEAARDERSRPSIIRLRSHIAWGAPTKQDTADAHGAPLGAEEITATKRAYGWPDEVSFLVPEAVHERGRQALGRGRELHARWRSDVERWEAEHPELAAEWRRVTAGELPDGWDADVPSFEPGGKPMATRSASGKVLNAIAARVPELIGGSADLAPSNKTLIAGGGDFTAADRAGRNLRFGVREHGMGAILNGMALFGGVRPYGGTFLIFSDYMRPSIRLAALMGLPVVYVFTHDSITLGEDGPTHQPVEQVMSLRLIPNLHVLRPADAAETAAAWRAALARRDGPTALVLTRHDLPLLAETAQRAAHGVPRGGYVLAEADGAPRLVLLATGSEVSIAVAARARLQADGVPTRVVSLPSWELLAAQGPGYRRELLPEGVPRLAVEAGVTLGWERFTGRPDAAVGVDRFGASAPWREVYERFGFSVDNIVARARALLEA